jgi:hypothetical protein
MTPAKQFINPNAVLAALARAAANLVPVPGVKALIRAEQNALAC